MAASSRTTASPRCRSAFCAPSLLRRLLPPSSRSPPTPVLLSRLPPPPQTQPRPSPSPPRRPPSPSLLLHPSSTPARSSWSWSETTRPTPGGRAGHRAATANRTSSTVCWSARPSTLCPSSCRHRLIACWAASLSSSRCCEFTPKF